MTKRDLILTAVASALTVTLALIFAPDHSTQARPGSTPASNGPDATRATEAVATTASAGGLTDFLLSTADLPGSAWTTSPVTDVTSAATRCDSDQTERPTAAAAVTFGHGQLEPAVWIETEPIIAETLFRYDGDVHERFTALAQEIETCLPLTVDSPDVDTVELLPLTVGEVGDDRWAARLHAMTKSGDSELVMDVVLVRVDTTVVQLLHLTALGPVDPALTSLIAERAAERVDR